MFKIYCFRVNRDYRHDTRNPVQVLTDILRSNLHAREREKNNLYSYYIRSSNGLALKNHKSHTATILLQRPHRREPTVVERMVLVSGRMKMLLVLLLQLMWLVGDDVNVLWMMLGRLCGRKTSRLIRLRLLRRVMLVLVLLVMMVVDRILSGGQRLRVVA